MLAIFVLILGIVLVTMVAAPMLVWDNITRKTCAELMDEEEYTPFAFDPTKGKRVGTDTTRYVSISLMHSFIRKDPPSLVSIQSIKVALWSNFKNS